MVEQKITVKDGIYYLDGEEIDFSGGENTGACFALLCDQRNICDKGKIFYCENMRKQEIRRRIANPYLYGLL